MSTVNILPKKTKLAMNKLIELTQQTIDAFENETNALAMNANIELMEIMKAKRQVNDVYQKAAEEFMSRQEEFLSFNQNVVRQLTDLQRRLSDAIKLNMNILEKINQQQQQIA